jgi:hypothetical protein
LPPFALTVADGSRTAMSKVHLTTAATAMKATTGFVDIEQDWKPLCLARQVRVPHHWCVHIRDTLHWHRVDRAVNSNQQTPDLIEPRLISPTVH